MADTDAAEAALRKANAQLAKDYDAVIYDPTGHDPQVNPAHWGPWAAMFGASAAPADVLDLACGSGSQLLAIASRATGGIVGIDISEEAVKLAKQKFAAAGRAADLRCMDLLDADAADLGQFDLISCVGSLYVVPGPVREKMLSLIGQCLKPGGVVLISCYAGLWAQMSVNLQRLVRAAVNPADPPGQQVAQGRAVVAQFLELARSKMAPEPVIRQAESAANLEDVIFYHEMLGGHLTALSTLELNQALSAYGIGFALNLNIDHSVLLQTAKARAIFVDGQDALLGGYRYALYVKWPGQNQEINPDAPGIIWSTPLRPQSGASYVTPDGGTATVPAPVTRAVLAALAERPRPWAEALDAARAALGGEIDLNVLRADVAVMLPARFLVPSLA